MNASGKWTKELIIRETKNLAFDLKRKPTKRDNSNLYFLSRKFFKSWNNLLKEAGFDTKINQNPRIPTKLDEDIAYFLGLLITDGHIVFDKIHKKYKILIFNSYEDEKRIIVDLIKKLFKYNPLIRTKKTEFSKIPNHEIYITSKDLAESLINKFEIPSGAKSRIVKIPPYLLNSGKEEIASFIRGVIDGDGSISINQVKIASGSERFLEGMKELLNRLYIQSGKVCKEKNRNTFVLYISSIPNIWRLYSLLYKNSHFFYLRKKKSWEKIFKSTFTHTKIPA
jgi:intein/homing endonuclease